MANEELSKDQETEGAAAPGSKRKILIMIPLILLLLGGGFFGWSKFMGQSEGKKGSGEKQELVQEPPPIVSMRPFVVNLVPDPTGPHYLKLEFDLELKPGSKIEEVERRRSELRDAIIILLTSKKSTELTTIVGKDRLRDEIITRLNSRLKYASVQKIYFKDFIIQ